MVLLRFSIFSWFNLEGYTFLRIHPLLPSCPFYWLRAADSRPFNSDDHYIYYCVQESLRRNGVAIMGYKRVWNAVFGCNLKNNRMIYVCFQGKLFNITVIQVYAPNSNAEEAEVQWFYEDLTRPFRTNTTEDEMVGWHHWLNGHGFGWTPGVGDGQGGLECCSSLGCKELDMTEQLNWTELICM